MASTPAVKRAQRSLIFLLVLIVGLVGIITLGVTREGATWTPKLALDLEGGTQIILAAKTDGQAVTGEQLNQAVEIIRQRVDASGVAEAEIATQGTENISVSIPGKADAATLQRIEASAQLDFRPVLYTIQGMPGGVEPDPEAEELPLLPDPLPETPYDQAWVTEGQIEQLYQFNCFAEEAFDLGESPADEPLVSCDNFGNKYILGPVEMSGDVITDAVAQPYTTQTGATTGEWVVQLTMNREGTETFGRISQRMYGAVSPTDQFAFVLDGRVTSAPRMVAMILDGRPSITGGFTQEGAEQLADQLKFGALPIGFTVQNQQDISATLGASQLQAGLLAGFIGLILVVIYSLFQYRVLGTVTLASLLVAGVLTYLFLVLLSWRQGYRLSLAGVAGIIVAVGITADSFILYFERIRDALRDGFSIDKAVENGWKRAFRTIVASDVINLLAAIVLFVLAVGSVQGFAFTLGLITVVDIIVVALFTHPMLTLLARTRFYRSGHPFSGLDPQKLGAVYRGRAQFREPVFAARGAGKKNSVSQKEAVRRQTIAERKAAEEAAELGSRQSKSESSKVGGAN